MNFLIKKNNLKDILLKKCSQLLSEVDRDFTSKTRGCFDRRYWSWKLVDYPEATYQRNIYLIAWYLKNNKNLTHLEFSHILNTIEYGFEYLLKIQNKDGSYDQAFPNERSFGATAFILNAMLSTEEIIGNLIPSTSRNLILNSIKKSAFFFR